MKSILAATAFAGALLATSAALAGHPVLPNGWPVPVAQTPYLSPEQIEHREFMNVQRETFPGNMPGSNNVRRGASVGAIPNSAPPPPYFSHDGTRRY